MTPSPLFDRLQILTGKETLTRLAGLRVAVFGLGGVGSWAAEGLARSGVGHLTLIDSDVVDVTNINRQVQTHSSNIGRPKCRELMDRLQLINPDCSLEALQKFYRPENAGEFDLAGFDHVLDCIDTVPSKVHLIRHAFDAGATVYSSMGAAFKLDPTRIRTASIWKTEGCPLARIIRRKLREADFAGEVTAVFSPEALPVKERRVNGSAVFVTACFGMALAGLVIRDQMGNRAGKM
jgi:tRNA A37 threonylcarbamoyladenosine dehydratase